MSAKADPIEIEWQRVLDEWGEDRAHKRFLTLCASLDRLSEAGTRYRAIKEDDEERSEVASRQIDRLLGLALQNLSALKTEPAPKRSKSLVLVLALAVSGTLIVGALFAWLRTM